MIDFGVMKVEGFASIAKDDFDWGQRGLNIIQAPNGFGKSTYINALVWTLYGQTLKGSVEPWEDSRTSSYCGTKVSLEFEIDEIPYQVIRYKSYPKFKNSLVFKIDGEIQDNLDKKETQALIIEELGYTFELFKNAIIFGQKLKRLISEKGPDKKKVFDDAFEVTYIAKANKLANEKLKDLAQDLQKIEHSLELTSKDVNFKKTQIDQQLELINDFEQRQKNMIKAEKDEIKELKKKLKPGGYTEKELQDQKDQQNHELEIFDHDAYSQVEIVKMEKELTKLESKRDSEMEKAEQVQLKINDLKTQLEKPATNCPECGKPYTAIERKTAIKNIKKFLDEREKEYQKHIDTIGNYRRQISEANGEISSAYNILENIDSINEEIERLDDLLEDIRKAKDEIKKHRANIKTIEEEKLVDRITDLRFELSQLEKLEKANKKEVRQVKKDVKLYRWMIKDPLSNAGLKAFIFNMMLDDINERLEYYTKFINLQVVFMMDMDSARKDLLTYVFKGDQPVPYDDLSGGQQQSVDIVTAFAIHDVVADTKECSLLVLDEVFESLDSNNIEIITELIQDKALNKAIYLITHQESFNPTNANILLLDYTDGVTSLI